jgi:hypothetical protein
MIGMGTGVSDEICKVEIKQAFGGGWFANYGHFSTELFATPLEAAREGNRRGQQHCGSTIRLIDLTQFRA